MPDRDGALNGLNKAAHVGPTAGDGAGDSSDLELHVLSGPQITLVGAWVDTVEPAANLLLSAIDGSGSTSAALLGEVITGKAGMLLRVEPLKWWLIDATLDDEVRPGADVMVCTDISHAYACVKVKGAMASTMLNRLISLDLRGNSSDSVGAGERDLPPSRRDCWVATVALHHIGVTIVCQGAEFTLFLPRSFALSLYEVLVNAATPFGARIFDNGESFSAATGIS